MVKCLLSPLRFAVLFSVSLSAAYPLAAPQPPKATASDLLSLLGPRRRSTKVNPLVAGELQSCFKFLVPFSPSRALDPLSRQIQGKPALLSDGAPTKSTTLGEENELVWWPPQSVLDLARLAVDSGGDSAAIQRVLDPTVIPVPDVEGCKNDRCELTRTPYGRHFVSEELNLYIGFLFEMIVSRGPTVGLDVSLSRYDLFHGHLFLAKETGRLGILFHAKEFPAFDKEVFPCNMGFCQTGSNVKYDDSMNLRNILWLAPLPSKSTRDWEAPGVLVVLDARPKGIIYRDIVPEYVNIARTIYEDDLGEVAVDVNYLNVGDNVPNYQLFIC